MEPHHYSLSIRGSEKTRRLLHKKKNGKVVNFRKPLTNTQHPKIYVITKNSEILYVGYSSQSITSRITHGLRSEGKRGYHGYGWKQHDDVELFVFVLEPFSGIEKQDKKAKHFAEAIEAELVFLVRTKTDKWPACQNEIHFNNDSPTKARALAAQMFEYTLSHIAIHDTVAQ